MSTKIIEVERHGPAEWIPNNGKKPDLPDGTLVQVMFANGCTAGGCRVDSLVWTRDDEDDDITRYRIHRVAPDVHRHPATPSYLEYPSFEESANFDPVPAPQPTEQPTFTVGTDLSDGKLSVVVLKHENGNTWVIHSEVIQIAEQKPDVSALVEALEQIRAIEDELYGGDWDEIEKARNIANEALATYRKGEEV